MHLAKEAKAPGPFRRMRDDETEEGNSSALASVANLYWLDVPITWLALRGGGRPQNKHFGR